MKKTFAAAMLHYFGKHPGETLGGFQAELAALTEADKAWFRENLATVGYEIEPAFANAA